MPLPSLRISTRLARNHGQSLEAIIPLSRLNERDEDLALFNEMRARDDDNFLLRSLDDIDDYLSAKSKLVPEFGLGLWLPLQGRSTDLLTADCSKNDYDWLLTPPDTPLFSSLDGQPSTVSSTCESRIGRQPVTISRAAMGKKMHRINRSSMSPNRLGPSPVLSHSRRRSSSAPHTHQSFVCSSMPTSKPYTPPNKPSSPASRSSSPTLMRKSTASSCSSVSSKRSATSPGKALFRNSASPKSRSWDSPFSGFSSDTPPNLRTSLSPRLSGRIRTESPGSQSGKQSPFTKHRKQIGSPATSRSISSSHSRGSRTSSGEDDESSLLSTPIGVMHPSMIKKNKSLATTKSTMPSKRPSRILSTKTIPKRPLDRATPKMENRKSQPYMFRPMLSNAPSATRHVGNADIVTHSLSQKFMDANGSKNNLVFVSSSVTKLTGSNCVKDETHSESTRSVKQDAKQLEKILIRREHEHDTTCRETECQSGTRMSEIIDKAGFASLQIDGHVLENGPDVTRCCSVCSSKSLVDWLPDENVYICSDCSKKESLSIVAESSAMSSAGSQENESYDEGIYIHENVLQVSCREENEEVLENFDQNVPLDLERVDKECRSCDPENAGQQKVGLSKLDFVLLKPKQQHFPKTSKSMDISVHLSRLSKDRCQHERLISMVEISSEDSKLHSEDLFHARECSCQMRSHSEPTTLSSSAFSELRRQTNDIELLLSSRREKFNHSRDDANAIPMDIKDSCSETQDKASETGLLSSCDCEEKIDCSGGWLENGAFSAHAVHDRSTNKHVCDASPVECKDQSRNVELLPSFATNLLNLLQDNRLGGDPATMVLHETCTISKPSEDKISNFPDDISDVMLDANAGQSIIKELAMRDRSTNHSDWQIHAMTDQMPKMLCFPKDIQENAMHFQTENVIFRKPQDKQDQESSLETVEEDVLCSASESKISLDNYAAGGANVIHSVFKEMAIQDRGIDHSGQQIDTMSNLIPEVICLPKDIQENNMHFQTENVILQKFEDKIDQESSLGTVETDILGSASESKISDNYVERGANLGHVFKKMAMRSGRIGHSNQQIDTTNNQLIEVLCLPKVIQENTMPFGTESVMLQSKMDQESSSKTMENDTLGSDSNSKISDDNYVAREFPVAAFEHKEMLLPMNEAADDTHVLNPDSGSPVFGTRKGSKLMLAEGSHILGVDSASQNCHTPGGAEVAGQGYHSWSVSKMTCETEDVGQPPTGSNAKEDATEEKVYLQADQPDHHIRTPTMADNVKPCSKLKSKCSCTIL